MNSHTILNLSIYAIHHSTVIKSASSFHRPDRVVTAVLYGCSDSCKGQKNSAKRIKRDKNVVSRILKDQEGYENNYDTKNNT